MKELTCIVCPIGCQLSVEESGENLSVTGNGCQRGVVYAREEIRAPKRIVTATCQIEGEAGYVRQDVRQHVRHDVRRVPVKTSSPCLREKIPALLHDIYKTKVSLPVKAGDVVIADWMGEGINVIATRTFG